MHDYIIILIIALIIGLQIYIFAGNISKINRYKNTIEDVKDFEIVEVSVPEEWIKEIEVKEILQNPEKFQELATGFSSTIVDSDEDPVEFHESRQISDQLYESAGEEDPLLNIKEKLVETSQELNSLEENEKFDIEEFDEEDFEDYKTNR
jgi:DNA-directed RNA polymerase subunit delta